MVQLVACGMMLSDLLFCCELALGIRVEEGEVGCKIQQLPNTFA